MLIWLNVTNKLQKAMNLLNKHGAASSKSLACIALCSAFTGKMGYISAKHDTCWQRMNPLT